MRIFAVAACLAAGAGGVQSASSDLQAAIALLDGDLAALPFPQHERSTVEEPLQPAGELADIASAIGLLAQAFMPKLPAVELSGGPAKALLKLPKGRGILLALAAAAADVGAPNAGSFIAGGGDLVHAKHTHAWDGTLRWVLYTARSGHGLPAGATILAFMGTDFDDTFRAREAQMAQDAAIPLGGEAIIRARDAAVRAVKEAKPDYVTGHSLGGLLAECAASYTGSSGASFGAPGPVGEPNLADGGKQGGARWATVLHRADPVVSLDQAGGRRHSHIGHAKHVLWLDGAVERGAGGDPATGHSMWYSYIPALQKL